MCKVCETNKQKMQVCKTINIVNIYNRCENEKKIKQMKLNLLFRPHGKPTTKKTLPYFVSIQ